MQNSWVDRLKTNKVGTTANDIGFITSVVFLLLITLYLFSYNSFSYIVGSTGEIFKFLYSMITVAIMIGLCFTVARFSVNKSGIFGIILRVIMAIVFAYAYSVVKNLIMTGQFAFISALPVHFILVFLLTAVGLQLLSCGYNPLVLLYDWKQGNIKFNKANQEPSKFDTNDSEPEQNDPEEILRYSAGPTSAVDDENDDDSEYEHKPLDNSHYIDGLDMSEQACAERFQAEWNEFNSLIGLANVKKQVKSLINKIQYNKDIIAEGLDVSDAVMGSMHMVFKGSPGTGKTTVARLIGEMYRDLGVLPYGQLIECKRQDLVAPHIGQTAPKTAKMFDRGVGGVLFVDEAYSLTSDTSGQDFGSESVATMLTYLEDHKSDMVVVVAGYGDDMEQFLDSNEGLRSRFANEIVFDDYSLSEMNDIFMLNLRKNKRQLQKGASELINDMIELGSQKKDFGGARGVKNLYAKVENYMQNRVVNTDSSNFSKEQKAMLYNTIACVDIKHVIKDIIKEINDKDKSDETNETE